MPNFVSCYQLQQWQFTRLVELVKGLGLSHMLWFQIDGFIHPLTFDGHTFSVSENFETAETFFNGVSLPDYQLFSSQHGKNCAYVLVSTEQGYSDQDLLQLCGAIS